MFNFIGVKKSETDELSGKTGLTPNRVITENMKITAVEGIKKFYADKGFQDAKVTIIEYASMTCSHCANFSTKIFPLVKEKYIDTGKVRFTLREFPFDPLATAAFMLARCKGNDKYYAMVELLFAQQKAWTGSDKPTEALLSVVRQAGFTQESFETCLKNKAIYDGVNFVKERGAKVFGVDSTPTFFINGEKRSGSISIEDMDKILTPLLGG